MSGALAKTEWGPGPWQKEPNKETWTDDRTGYPCIAIRHPEMGHWCGYVGVDAYHPAFGRSYNGYDQEDLDARTKDFSRILKASGGDPAKIKIPPEPVLDELAEKIRDLQVHGGLTFSGPLKEGDKAYHYFGFDCAHAWDIAPGLKALMKSIGNESFPVENEEYRDLDFVRKECASLAKQISNLG